MIGTLPAQNFAHINGNISATIVANPGTLLDNAVPLTNPHFKYKVATILALDLMLSPEEILVGVIKTARRHGVEIDHGLPSFHSHLLPRNERAEQ